MTSKFVNLEIQCLYCPKGIYLGDCYINTPSVNPISLMPYIVDITDSASFSISLSLIGQRKIIAAEYSELLKYPGLDFGNRSSSDSSIGPVR